MFAVDKLIMCCALKHYLDFPVHMQMQKLLESVSHDHRLLPPDAEHKLETFRPKLQSDSNEYVLSNASLFAGNKIERPKELPARPGRYHTKVLQILSRGQDPRPARVCCAKKCPVSGIV